jgi:hypothetical protein
MFFGFPDADSLVQGFVLLLLYDFLSLKNDLNAASKSKNQKNCKIFCFSCHLEGY